MPAIQETPGKQEQGSYKEPKMSPAMQRKMDETNKNLAKMTKEQLDMLFGVTKPEK